MWSNFFNLWAGLALIAFLGLPNTVRAEDKSKILVLPYQSIGKGVTTEILEQTTNLVGSELESSGVPVLEGSDSIKKLKGKTKKGARAKDAPTGDPAASEKANKLIKRGRTDIEDQEFESAIKKLKKAIRLLDDNGDAVDDLSVLSGAYLLIATAYFQEGEEDEADDALVKAVHFSPDKKLSPNEYPPIFIRSYQRARYNVLRRPRARLEIKAASNAQIRLDGRSMGRSPLVLTKVLPGTHWISAQSPGETPHVKKLLVRSRRTITLSLGVEDGPDERVASPSQNSDLVAAIATNEISRSHIAQLQALGRKRGVEFVLFGGIHETSTAYNIHSVLLNVKSGETGRLTSVAFDLDLLTAQIEVYKLADDIRQQSAGEDPLSKVITAAKFRLDPKLNLTASKSRRAIAAGAASARIRTVAAAPSEVRAPVPKASMPWPTQLSSNAELAPPAGQRDKSEADIYDSNETTAPAGTPIKTGKVVPKDEADDAVTTKVTSKMLTEESEDEPFLPRRRSAVFDSPDDDDGPGDSMWWMWVAVGVAVAGASGTGIYFLASDSPAETGELTIRW